MHGFLDRMLGRSGVRVWQWTRHDDNTYSWRELSPEEFYKCPSVEDFIVIDDYETYSRRTDAIYEIRAKPKIKEPKVKAKPWVQMNNKPAWLRGK